MSDNLQAFFAFVHKESVLTLSIADDNGPWSAPVLYVADTQIEPFALYFLSSPNSRHVKALDNNVICAASIYSEYTGRWQSICGAQMRVQISAVEEHSNELIKTLYFDRFPEVEHLIDQPKTNQEKLIGAAFDKSYFYQVVPSFVRFTNNADAFAGRTEWYY